MVQGGWTLLEWAAVIEYELLLFAGVCFLVCALDELVVDVIWLWLKIRGRIDTVTVSRADLRLRRLSGITAVFIPAWQESAVIGHTLRHMRAAWPASDLRFYIGCYGNDPRTVAAACKAAENDCRVRVITHERAGPTTKADCLNRLYRALQDDEMGEGHRVRAVILHDAEDVVDPAALALIDRAMDDNDYVQLPVLPLIPANSRWVAGHYAEEFAEAHGKSMIVRDALRVGIPAAGVGCAFCRDLLQRLVTLRDGSADGNAVSSGPFRDQSLTEDYELGLNVTDQGGCGRFLRVRADDGTLIATRSYFPATLPAAVRQKARWMHGIALQGWDSLGWTDRWAENWMRLRDRRGPFAALILLSGYALFFLSGVLSTLALLGFDRPTELSPFVLTVLTLNLAALIWRVAMRFAFTSRDYDLREGIWSILRIPLANVIAIMAARRALMAYARSLAGRKVVWDKTVHDTHPLTASAACIPAIATAFPAGQLARDRAE